MLAERECTKQFGMLERVAAREKTSGKENSKFHVFYVDPLSFIISTPADTVLFVSYDTKGFWD